MELKIEAPISLRINRPIPEVFSAFTDPLKAREYLCDAMTGEWKAGGNVVWRFGETNVVLKIQETIENEFLRFHWNGADFLDYETEVSIRFIPQEPGVTGVKILNSGFETNQISLKSALDACCGWENVLCRLKGWLEYGIDLRK
jgi:uncharacterized protein YndB with AHSA1/START domain